MKRAAKRGAAFTEALVLCVVLISLCSGVLYLFGAYENQLFTVRQARGAAWTEAISGCGPGAGGGASASTTVSPGMVDPLLAPAAGSMTTALTIAQGPSLMAPLLPTPRETRLARSSSKAPGVRAGALPAVTAKTMHSVMCNEIPEDVSRGDIQMTIQVLYGRLL
jgi:hypothetical protein